MEVFLYELNWYTGFVERYYIQRLYKSWQELQGRAGSSKQPSLKDVPRDVLYFGALLFQMSAVALHFVPPKSPAIKILDVEEMSCRDRLSERYSDQGQSFYSSTLITCYM
jgi:hypothetical protein